MKYLDNNGLLYVIKQIKTWLNGKVSKEDGKGLSTNDYTTEEKNKLAGLSNYTLPTASADTKGGVKIGSGLQMNGDVLSATGGGTADAVDWENVTNKPTKLTDFTNDLAYKTAYDASTNKILTESDLAIKTLEGTTNNKINFNTLEAGIYIVKGNKIAGTSSMESSYEELAILTPYTRNTGTAYRGLYILTGIYSYNGVSGITSYIIKNENGVYSLMSDFGGSIVTEKEIGARSNLTTKNKQTIVAAINEINTVFNKGYQTASDVNSIITGKGYQTASDVNSIITGKGYQTASDVETAITNKISSVMTYKGTVANYSDLPTNAKVGDTYNITNKSSHNKAGDNAAWNGTSWDILAGTIDLSGYYTKAEMEALTNDEIDGIFTAE